MVVNETIEHDWARGPRVPVILLQANSTPFSASGALVSVCAVHTLFFTFSVFISNFSSGTVLSTSTRVQTAEVEHVVFPWEINCFVKDCVVLVTPMLHFKTIFHLPLVLQLSFSSEMESKALQTAEVRLTGMFMLQPLSLPSCPFVRVRAILAFLRSCYHPDFTVLLKPYGRRAVTS